jgi:glycosyltransferase involved in cell wall biosynthesis
VRIAQVTPVYPPYFGGMARVAFEYTERLRARGHDVQVFTPRETGTGPAGADEPAYVHRISAYFRVGHAALLPSLAPDLAGFEIVHLHYPFYGVAEPVAHARASGEIRRLVLTCHMDASAAGLKGTAFDVHRETVQPWIVSHADTLLVSSRDYAESSSLAQIDGALEHLQVLTFGVDLDRFHPGDEPGLRTTLGIDATIPVVLFVGTLDEAHRFKGLDVLFAALTKLRHVPWRLLIIGDGADRPRLARQAADAGLEARVLFAGAVADEALAGHYRLADIHVLPSTNRAEAFGLVTLEAAATGVPSVVSDLPGAAANVIHDGTGVVVPAANSVALSAALQRLLGAPDERRRLGYAARLRAERECSWPPLMDRLEAIYQAVVAGR